MKKQALLKSILILLPILAVGLATTTDSVMVFDSLAGTTEYYSYFDLLPVADYQMLTPLAGMLCIASGILAVVYLAAGKKKCLTASGYTALAVSILAILPVIQGGDVKVMPNVGVPILMLAHYAYAYFWGKNETRFEGEKKAPRLKKR